LLVRRLGADFIAEPNIFNLNMYSILLNYTEGGTRI
jgi:hypothetical protein